MYGLGRMGLNMAKRLLRDEHRVVVYNRSPEPIQEAAEFGAAPSASVEDFVDQLTSCPLLHGKDSVARIAASSRRGPATKV
jgi:3-hydroxyisobutyrate dehydrogenase-like beta-hydroxyacid dehydrogenase